MKSLALICLVVCSYASAAPETKPACDQPEAHRIGVMVIEVTHALNHRDDKNSMETIARYGTDTRHYEMIRGWLVQRLSSAKSQLDATRDNPERTAELQKSVDFLRRAIRRIDLE